MPVKRGGALYGFFGVASTAFDADWPNKETESMMIHAERAIQGILDLKAKMPWNLLSEKNDKQESDVKKYLTPEKIAHLVTAEFENIRKKPKDDLWDEIGREEFKSKVKGLVDNGKTIGFVLTAFPFKSANHVAKVMGPMPDVGERIAIGRLHKFAATVSCFYEPGAVVVMSVTDEFLQI